jgi:hypothetical protein
MPDAYPRASKSIRLDDGTVIRLNENAFEKARSCPAWSQWCDEGVLKLAEWCGLAGLSKQQAGEWLLTMGRPLKLWELEWERTNKIWSLKPGGADYMKEIYGELRRREPLLDQILEYVKGACDAEVTPEELLQGKLRAAIIGTAAKEGKPLNRATGPGKVQIFWQENVESDVQSLWREIKGSDVPLQEEIKKLMGKKPRGRPRKKS